MSVEWLDFYWLFAPVPQSGLHGVFIIPPPKRNTTIEQLYSAHLSRHSDLLGMLGRCTVKRKVGRKAPAGNFASLVGSILQAIADITHQLPPVADFSVANPTAWLMTRHRLRSGSCRP
jgi:hypothetical protein